MGRERGEGACAREIALMSSLHAGVPFTPGIKRLFLRPSSIAITAEKNVYFIGHSPLALLRTSTNKTMINRYLNEHK